MTLSHACVWPFSEGACFPLPSGLTALSLENIRTVTCSGTAERSASSHAEMDLSGLTALVSLRLNSTGVLDLAAVAGTLTALHLTGNTFFLAAPPLSAFKQARCIALRRLCAHTFCPTSSANAAELSCSPALVATLSHLQALDVLDCDAALSIGNLFAAPVAGCLPHLTRLRLRAQCVRSALPLHDPRTHADTDELVETLAQLPQLCDLAFDCIAHGAAPERCAPLAVLTRLTRIEWRSREAVLPVRAVTHYMWLQRLTSLRDLHAHGTFLSPMVDSQAVELVECLSQLVNLERVNMLGSAFDVRHMRALAAAQPRARCWQALLARQPVRPGASAFERPVRAVL